MTYKIIEFNDSYSISKNTMSIPRDARNADYKQFIEDIALGNDTVEGPDVIEPSYVELRAAEYPSMVDQLDMQYWDGVNGTTNWADAIQAVKDAHPTSITGGTTVGDVPSWVQEEADAWLAAKQLADYTVAIERLSQYVIADGREEVVESRATGEQVLDEDTEEMVDVMHDVTTVTAIEPVEATVTRLVPSDNIQEDATEETIENPLITQDNAERAEAQAVVDATPQAVIDTYNGE